MLNECMQGQTACYESESAAATSIPTQEEGEQYAAFISLDCLGRHNSIQKRRVNHQW